MANSIQQAEPTLASLLELFKLTLMMQLCCHQVGEIVSFDATTQTAEVQIKMMKMQNGKLIDYPVLIDCPCIILGGGEGRITFPITAGDSCLVLFNDRDIDNWYAGGQKMLPRTERMHSYSDAIALVGIRNLQNKIEDYLVNGTELKYGKSTIKLENNKVTITNNKSTITMDKDDITINGNVNVIQNTIDDNSLHAYVISSYHNGTDWYRVWSDGWCEQGGYYNGSIGTDASTTITLLKNYKDTNYSVYQQTYASTSISEGTDICVQSKTTSNFILCNEGYVATMYGLNWEAKGYIK